MKKRLFKKLFRFFLMGIKTQSGYSLISLALSIIILSGLLLISTTVSQKFLDFFSQSTDENQLVHLVRKKVDSINARGYWIWNVDTQNPQFGANSFDPSNQWKEDLELLSGVQGQIHTQFLKESQDDLIVFSTENFEGNLSRRFVELTITLSQEPNRSVSHTIVLVSIPTLTVLNGILMTLQQALMIYNEDNGNYPVSGQLGNLVDSILDEIPNDPFTEEGEKVIHTEELVDWSYTHDSENNVISIYAYSHPSNGLSWTY